MRDLLALGARLFAVGAGLALGACGSSDEGGLNGSGGNAGAGGSSAAGGVGGSSAGGSSAGGSSAGGSSAGGSSAGGSSAGGSSGSAGAGAGGSSGNQSGGSAGTGAAAGTGGAPAGGAGGAVGGTGGRAGAGGASTGGTGGAAGCKSNTDCEDVQYCKKAGCGAELLGRCEPRGSSCGPAQDVVCGCDGVSYWNECLAEREGAIVAYKGECRPGAGGPLPRTCGGVSRDCPIGAKCAELHGNGPSCIAPGVTGQCWVVPDSCAPIVVGGRYRPCSVVGPPQACVSQCDAIAAETPHFIDNSCPQ